MNRFREIINKMNLSDISFKKVLILVIVVIVVLFFVVKTVNVGNSLPENSLSNQKTVAKASDLKEVTVVMVTDGNTIWVENEGKKSKVKLLGIECPKPALDKDDNTEGQDATDFTKSLIKNGDTVYLQKDKSDKDKYGKYLRYVWLEMPQSVDDENEIKSKMLNAIILISGHATAAGTEQDTRYSELFEGFMN